MQEFEGKAASDDDPRLLKLQHIDYRQRLADNAATEIDKNLDIAGEQKHHNQCRIR
jgi:hypothetical protein